MHPIADEVLKKCFLPFDVVSDKDGNVGLIQEVNLNDCQPEAEDQVSYSVCWLVGRARKVAWFRHAELDRHSNIFEKISEMSCHPFGRGKNAISILRSAGRL